MTERRVPLGNAYVGRAGQDVVSFPVVLRVLRVEVLDTLADFYAVQKIDREPVPAASSFGVRKVRDLLEREYTIRGGSMAGDMVNSSDFQDRAYAWAEKVMARVWPSES